MHGASAIVALTAQNTVGVTAIHPVPPPMILEQVRAVSSDIGVDAVKVGMLGNEETIGAAVEAIGELGDIPVVVDPVMIAESRAVLLDPAAKAALIERVLPLATVATPNLPEAGELTGLGERADPRSWLARSTRWGPPTSLSPAATPTRPSTTSSMARPSSGSPAHGTLPAPPTARAAPTHRRWRRTWRWG